MHPINRSFGYKTDYVKFDLDWSTLTSNSKHNLKDREIILIAIEPQETGQKIIKGQQVLFGEKGEKY